jgi:hypothetical protein
MADVRGSGSFGPTQWRLSVQYVARHGATHEAGHAVIGRVLNVPCGDASIADGIACGFDIEQRVSGRLGIAGIGSSAETWREWRHQGRPRCLRSVLIARAIAFMAGAEAEIAFFGENIPDGDSYDREGVAEIIVGAPKWVESRLRSFTRTLVHRHKDSIEAVSRRLLRDVTVSDGEVR